VRGQALKQKATALGIAAALVALDQLTKAWVLRAIPAGGSIELIPGVLRLHVAENSGVAFTLLRGAGPILVLGIVAVVILIVIALGSSEGWLQVLSLGIVLGGAVGNLVDRFTRGPGLLDGRVVDWIDPSFFPTFNVADTSITIGVALLLIASFRSR
jgi:signal peptidase II